MNKVTVSAPGKLMLLGEHAVVYNHPCLVTAVDKRVRATVETLDSLDFQLEAKDVKITDYKKPLKNLGKGDIPKGAQFVEMAVKNTLELFLRHSGLSRISLFTAVRDSGVGRSVDLPRMTVTVGIRVTTKSEFSSQSGFGSSSASTVCAIKAVSEILGINLTDKEIFDLSYKTVLDIQEKGSGFDVAAAVYGGTLYFVTGGKVIEPIKIESLPLIVGYSGIKADTASLIKKVKESFSNRKDRLNEIYSNIEVLVNQAKDALVKRDWATFGTLMNKNQEYLYELGVSIDKLDAMIKVALNVGAYGAKLSGAGGGDCIVALVSDKKREKVEEAIKSVGGEVISIRTNAEGVRVENE